LGERHLEIAAYLANLLQIHSAVDHPAAIGADALKGAASVSSLDALGEISGRCLRRSTGQAEDLAGATPLLSASFALYQEPPDFLTTDQNWPLIIDGLKTLFEPTPDRVLVNFEEPRQLFHRVAVVNFCEARIGVPMPHVF
jgi:hypothetical protein